MPGPKAPVTQSELTRYAKAMRAAGFDGLRMVIEKPDGTKVSIVASEANAEAEHHDIDVMIESVPDPMKRQKNPFPGVNTVEDRHGKLRHRLRRTIRGRTVDVYLPGPYGSPDFRAAYEQAVEGTRIAPLQAQPGIIGYLIATYLESSAFRNLSMTTRRDKARRLDWIREAIGKARLAEIQPRHVEKLMAKKGGLVAGNRLKKDLGQLFRFAAKYHGFKGQNPAALADANKVRSGGFHTWTNDEVESFRAKYETGSKARLALELLLGTGAARQDAAALTRRNIRGGRIVFRRGKTGVEVNLPILPELGRELAHRRGSK